MTTKKNYWITADFSVTQNNLDSHSQKDKKTSIKIWVINQESSRAHVPVVYLVSLLLVHDKEPCTAINGHMVNSWLKGKLRSATSKTKESQAWLVNVSLFQMTQGIVCSPSPARCFLYHVAVGFKGPICFYGNGLYCLTSYTTTLDVTHLSGRLPPCLACTLLNSLGLSSENELLLQKRHDMINNN